MKKLFILLVLGLFLLLPQVADAHPGGTAADGCHYCRSNCDSWGVPWNERHCHGGGSSSTDDSGSSGSTPPSTNTVPQPVYVAPTSTPIPQAKTIEVLRRLIKERKEKRQLWSDAILSHIRNRAVIKTASRTIIPLYISSGGSLPTQPTGQPQTTSKQQEVPSQGFYQVSEVVDGDTIRVVVDGKVEPIRILAIDTPETKDPRKAVQCFGQAASNKMNELVGGKSVRLERDTTQPDRDKYKRLLRYVYLQDGTDAGAQMIKQGFAFAYTRFPSDKLDEYRGYEKQARETNAGLWGSCQIQENGTSKSTNPL